MSDRNEPPLAEHVDVRVDEVRLARQWDAVSTRLRKRHPFAVPALAFVAVAVVAVVLVVVRPWRGDAPLPTPTVAASDDALMLPDGSRVSRAPHTQLDVRGATTEDVWLSLAAGSIDLDVTHVEGRSFVVSAGGHDVIVVGTKFTVTHVDRRVSVTVREGRVRIRARGVEKLLGAGESWAGPEVEEPASAIDDDAGAAIELPANPTPTPSAPVEGPKELLARATAARADGKPREAAAALDTLRKKHRSDARAGLAAFELGRVRLDALSDPAGAAEAFADAVALAPNAPFREDAEARRVEALERAGDVVRCVKARDAFLERHPQSFHAPKVTARCTKR